MDHDHEFEDWPFQEPTNTTVYTTKNVVHGGQPILTVAHDHDGDWQFLCGMTDDPDDMVIACFGCMFEHHPLISQFRDLPRGWIAWRDDAGSSWQQEELEMESE